MAAKTPDRVVVENIGDLTLTIGIFDASVTSGNDIDDGDYWTSGIQNIIGYWGNLTDDPTQTKEGVDITLTTASTGKLTFQTGEGNRTGLIYVLSSSA